MHEVFKYLHRNVLKLIQFISSMVKVKDSCIGCGLCAAECPDVFEMGDDGKAQVKAGADTKKDCVKTAKKNCPADAIA